MPKASGFLILVLWVASQALYADDWITRTHCNYSGSKIISVIDTRHGYVAYLAERWAPDPNSGGNHLPTGVVILIGGIPAGYVDGDMIWDDAPDAPLHYAGTYSYTTVTGATATVRVYSPNQDWATKRLAYQAAGN